MYEVKKILTDSPFVDEIIYYTKYIALNCVIKNEADAFKNETSKSQIASNIYMACVEGKARFNIFISFPKEVLIKSMVPDSLITACMLEPSNVPQQYRAAVTKNMIEYTINNYEEYNNYYRKLYGLPNYGERGIKVPEDYIDESLKVDYSKCLHEMTIKEINILESSNILDDIRADYPNDKYLNYLGDMRINPYDARKASNFQLLYIPNITSKDILEKFKSKYDTNRLFTLKTIYSEAFKYGSDYYDNFIMILILVQTIVDILSEVQEFILRREIFDTRSIQYLFESNGIPYWGDIPMKYQLAMVKNMHTLIKYKSSTRNLVDICSLFGFDDVAIFRYYLLRDKKMNEDGTFVFEYKTDKDGNFILDKDGNKIPDNTRNYELKFIKVPITDSVDNYIKDSYNEVDYDSVVKRDPYWNGEDSHDKVKEAIVNQEISVARTKYIGVDTAYDLTRISFDLPYFYNMIFYMSDNDYAEGRRRFDLDLYVPCIKTGHLFKLTDILSYLFCLGYIYIGIEDRLMTEISDTLTIEGFNFEADINELKTYCINKGYTLEDLIGVGRYKEFQQPLECLSYAQLAEIFITNREIYENIMNKIVNADDKNIYDIYMKIYNSLYITDFNMNFFRMSNGKPASTWTEYLEDRDTVLYDAIMKYKEMSREEVGTQIVNGMIEVIGTVDEWLDSDAFKYIYSTLPGSSADYIQIYMEKVINFFKSYKTHLLEINTIYKFYNKLENTIKVIDGIDSIISKINPYDNIKTADMTSKLFITLKEAELINMDEKTFIKSWRWVSREFPDIFAFDTANKVGEIKVTLHKKDSTDLGDEYHVANLWFTVGDHITTDSYISTTSLLNPSDNGSIKKDDCLILETYE